MRTLAAGDSRRGRILLVTSNFPRWVDDNTTPFILHLASDLRALEWDVQVLAPHHPGAKEREVLEGVPVERFHYCWPESAQTVCYGGGALGNLQRHPGNYVKLPLLVAAQLAAIRRSLRGGRFDLVHSHWILPQGFTAALAARALPHVTTVHGGDIFALRGRLLAAFKRFALTRADAVTVNSSATESAVREVAPALRRVLRIPMGGSLGVADDGVVSRLRDQYAPGGAPLILFVGRLVEEKGVEDLLEAMVRVASAVPSARALIVGDGPLLSHLQAVARRAGVLSQTSFAGWVNSRQIVNYLRAADVFVGPSRVSASGWKEAQGLTFTEAMLAGVPVIATAQGGVVDAVVHDQTGLLVPERAPAAIAAAIVRLIEEPDLRRKLVASARHLAESQFTRQASARRFAELYASLIDVRK